MRYRMMTGPMHDDFNREVHEAAMKDGRYVIPIEGMRFFRRSIGEGTFAILYLGEDNEGRRIVLKKFEFESDNSITNIKYFLIDVLKNREISNKIASVFNIDHESPQLIIVKNGELVHNSSHSDISFSDVIHRVD